MEFIAIDVETANPDLASICQIGLAHFRDGALVDKWVTLVDPGDYFDPMNVRIHGIHEPDVVGAPALPDVAAALSERMSGRIAVSHTHFDRLALRQALAVHGLRQIDCTWLDSARVARRTWNECSQRGYGLAPVCERIGFEFQHHDALEDAKACGHVLLAAIETSGLSVDDWVTRVSWPISGAAFSREPIARDGSPEGPLFSEVMVFTGALDIPRREAAGIAASIGCEVDENVTKRTTLLVVGDQDVQHLVGHDKSSKHRKAEALIADGHAIRILRETDFRQLAQVALGGS